MRKLILLFVFVGIAGSIIAQPYLYTLINEVNELHQQRRKMYSSEKKDSIFLAFDQKIQELLYHPDFCGNWWNSLGQPFSKNAADVKGEVLAYSLINDVMICSSDDDRMLLVSWDDLGGGSYRSYSNYMLYKNDFGVCQTIKLDSAKEGHEVGYYQIERVQQKDRVWYFLFGYGTYGGGRHHRAVKILEQSDTGFQECLGCYPNGEDLVVFAPRLFEIDLQYDPVNREISYKQFAFDEETGFYSGEYEHIALKFSKGKFK
ncbi:MAG: hypothetical protein AAF587_06805 [Bacteroidota bacterium]